MDPGLAEFPRAGYGVTPDPDFQADVGAAKGRNVEVEVEVEVGTEGTVVVAEMDLQVPAETFMGGVGLVLVVRFNGVVADKSGSTSPDVKIVGVLAEVPAPVAFLPLRTFTPVNSFIGSLVG
jgi:hypothetical protein